MNSVDQELIEAAFENNLPEVRRLLSVGADANATTNNGTTPLIVASREGHVQVFQALREYGADIEAKNSASWTPLHLACLGGHLAVLNELLSPNDSHGATTGILGKRTRQGANIDPKNNDGDTPLHNASSKGHLAIVKVLVRSGADMLAVNDYGNLPIHVAVYLQKSAVAKCLLQHFYATIIRRLPLHELLKDLMWTGDHNSSDVPPLRFALHRNVLGTDDVVEIVEFLVDRNPAMVCSRDQDGSLPLHVACRRGVSFDIVHSLVDLYKASVKSVTPGGDLPLFLACELPEPSLDTIFLLMKLYPDLVYR
jgi:ankyrin repeat protein